MALCNEDALPAGCEFGKADMDKLLPPTVLAASNATTSASNANPVQTGSASGQTTTDEQATFSPSSGTSGDSSSR